MRLCPQLEQVRREAAEIDARAAELCRDLDEEQLAWRESPGRWSLAENLVHLTVTNQTSLPNLDRALEEARRKQWFRDGPYELGWFGKLFVWYVEPPPKLRLPAPKQLVPLLHGSASDALPAFLGSQQEMGRRLEEANGLDLARAMFQSPYAGFIRMNVMAVFRVYIGHARRHLRQMERVRAALPGRG